MARKIDFFICGVQKGGTTALDSFLREHPSVEMAREKEVHFFDDETIAWDMPDYAKLHSFFDDATPSRCRGEATPIYSYWPSAMERLRAYNHAAKLILMLRHPVLRAFSHWRMETTRGFETLPFSQAIQPAARMRVYSAPRRVHRVFSYVERGFYAPQIERLLSLFPRDQLLILRTDKLWVDPEATLQAVQEFLDIPVKIKPEQRYIVPVESDKDLGIERADIEYLSLGYYADIMKTQILTGIDLSDWVDRSTPYKEPIPS